MTELIVLCAFVPLMFLPLPSFKGLAQACGWTAIAIALLCHGYTIFLHYQEPLLWIPAASFLSVFVINLASQRYRRGLSTLAVLFVAQALLAANLGYIIVLLALSDTLLGAELFLSAQVAEKNRAVQSIYQSAISLLPATAGLLLHLDGNFLNACVAATIALRLFSWPVSHWLIDISGKNKMFPAYMGIVSSFALWHNLSFPKPEVWAVVWLLATVVFTVGSRYTEVFASLALGLFALNPVWGVLFTALWPLLGRRHVSVYTVGLLTGAAGVVLSDAAAKVFLPEAAFAIAGFSGLAIARVFVAAPWAKTSWYFTVSEYVFSLIWVGLLIFLVMMPKPQPVLEITPLGVTFGAAFILMFALGKILKNKKPNFFKMLPSLSPQVFSKELWKTEFMQEKRGETPLMVQGRPRQWLFDSIESEAYLALLLGFLGAFLLWVLR